ncbi:hypothetical protein GGR58DRAFT_380385 [Xylaria digitata]|nr:hypothetical protein GGR58DRAFT_380385 [Xylaria digitata]
MDFGSVPKHLPQLTQSEQMIIARVHVYVEVRQIRGASYRYRGHVCHFARNVSKIWDQLPLLPDKLDYVIVKTRSARLQQQVLQDFRVRRQAIHDWLVFLKKNHPSYQNILVDHGRIKQLPKDGNIFNNLRNVIEVDKDMRENDPITDEKLAELMNQVDVTGVPDLVARQEELELLREEVRGHDEARQQRHLELPAVRTTPLDEFNRSKPLISIAFPTLFLRGMAEFVKARSRSVKFNT